VIRSIAGRDGGMGGLRIMVMAGSEDKLMGVRLMEDMAWGLQARGPDAGRGEEARCCCCAE